MPYLVPVLLGSFFLIQPGRIRLKNENPFNAPLYVMKKASLNIIRNNQLKEQQLILVDLFLEVYDNNHEVKECPNKEFVFCGGAFHLWG